MICCLCCASGPIQATLSLDRTGFVPGEFIFVNAQINNNSSRKLVSSKIQLQQVSNHHLYALLNAPLKYQRELDGIMIPFCYIISDIIYLFSNFPQHYN